MLFSQGMIFIDEKRKGRRKGQRKMINRRGVEVKEAPKLVRERWYQSRFNGNLLESRRIANHAVAIIIGQTSNSFIVMSATFLRQLKPHCWMGLGEVASRGSNRQVKSILRCMLLVVVVVIVAFATDRLLCNIDSPDVNISFNINSNNNINRSVNSRHFVKVASIEFEMHPRYNLCLFTTG